MRGLQLSKKLEQAFPIVTLELPRSKVREGRGHLFLGHLYCINEERVARLPHFQVDTENVFYVFIKMFICCSCGFYNCLIRFVF